MVRRMLMFVQEHKGLCVHKESERERKEKGDEEFGERIDGAGKRGKYC